MINNVDTYRARFGGLIRNRRQYTIGVFSVWPLFPSLSNVLCADQFETSTSPPHWAYPGHLTVHRAQGGGGFERCIGRVGNLSQIYVLFWRNTPVSFFGFCRVWQIYKIEFRLCQWLTLSKGSLKELWRCQYGISLFEKCEQCWLKTIFAFEER